MGVKGFVEGGIASIVAGCSTHPLDLIKVRMQLQGEAAAAPQPALRPALAFHAGGHAVAAVVVIIFVVGTDSLRTRRP